MANQTKWLIDPNHSEILFKVKHLMISTINCHFKTYSGSVISEHSNFNDALIQVKIDARSISTNHAERDKHLRSNLFLDIENYPTIEFEGQLKNMDTHHELLGNLTLCGITKNILLKANYTGTGAGLHKEIRAGFEVSGKINRKDFGLHFNLLTEAGSAVVGEDLTLLFAIELVQQLV
jgi:polyisoprenoid-binding protein YceI